LARILVVDVPEAVQLARLQARDGVSPDLARRMLAAQASRAQRLALADDVIVNDGTLADLQAAVARLHTRYLAEGSG
ncbi:MAG TPA: dephospho-CoA kinase, partial [Arenimonas sp.]|nr:dephospho-CoA kinase [Arenimonas sp.]